MIVLQDIKKRYSSKEKKYIGKYFLRNIAHKLLDRINRKSEDENSYVLKGINIAINKGEHVGILGRNKAGKSTLLQIISGITEPTSGTLKVQGKIIPVFGQGSISTPDLTGREYIRLYASALGTRNKEIAELEQKIIDFSEIAEIDTPVKFYSTGMRTRLSLAVTLLINADIYILDEVFYGSDEFFRQKAIARIQNLMVDCEKTLILVSHHEEILQQFCERIILIEDGKVKMDGSVKLVLEGYRDFLNSKSNH